jgi:predicted nucleic acid-binding protein
LPEWVHLRQLEQPLSAQILNASLGAGESEAIALALEIRADVIVMDDGAARRLARLLGLQVVGTLGVLLQAKHLGLTPALRPLLDALRPLPFHMKKSLYDALLSAAGE